jgi:hypothetical protein
MVSYRSSDGKQSYHQTDELSEALQFVEHLRNAEAIEHARVFKMEELSFEYRPYYRVELATTLPPPPATEGESSWTGSAPEAPAAEAPAAEEADTDPLAAAWSMSERVEHVEPAEGDSVGAGTARRGLFGR